MEPDINKNLTDEQLDDLILQSLHRQQMVDDINVAVMKQLRRTTRRRSLLRWGKIVVFAFGLPLMLFVFGWLLWTVISQQDVILFSIHNFRLSVFTCLLLPIATMLYASWRAIANFSLNEV